MDVVVCVHTYSACSKPAASVRAGSLPSLRYCDKAFPQWPVSRRMPWMRTPSPKSHTPGTSQQFVRIWHLPSFCLPLFRIRCYAKIRSLKTRPHQWTVSVTVSTNKAGLHRHCGSGPEAKCISEPPIRCHVREPRFSMPVSANVHAACQLSLVAFSGTRTAVVARMVWSSQTARCCAASGPLRKIPSRQLIRLSGSHYNWLSLISMAFRLNPPLHMQSACSLSV